MPDEPTSYAATLGYQFNLEYQKVLILANNRLQSLNYTQVVSSLGDLQILMNQTQPLSVDIKFQNWFTILGQINQSL